MTNTAYNKSLQIHSPLNPAVTIHGRTRRQQQLPLFWTASGVEFLTDASTLAFELEADFTTREPWIRIEVDGASVLRMPVPHGTHRIFVWREMLSHSVRSVRLYKETQPMQRDPRSLLTLHAIVCDGSLYPIPQRPFKLEFIGDSISSGEGLAGAVSTRDGVSLVFSTEGHYALQTAAALHADCNILSQSGWGLSAGWDNDRTKTMPPYYDQICGLIPGHYALLQGAHENNDFTLWQPDIVIVHLGYNDGFALKEPPFTDGFSLNCGADGFPDSAASSHFIQTGIIFLRNLRLRNPNARLVWSYGMFGQVMEPCIRKTIEQYQAETGDTVVYIPLPDTPQNQIASNNHPGIAAHTAVANILISALKPMLTDLRKE